MKYLFPVFVVFSVVGILVLTVIAFWQYDDYRNRCIAAGGIPTTGRDFSLCLNPDALITLPIGH